MASGPREIALIVGTGKGLSASLARLCAKEGMAVAVAARNAEKLAPLVKETGAKAYTCDAGEAAQVDKLFADVGRDLGVPDLVVFNASQRVRGPVAELDPAAVQRAIHVTCFGGFLVGRAAAQAMLKRGSGSIQFTGASASVKGYVNSATFAMGKFGLRGLAQSMARELAPRNIHVAHFVIDGGIAAEARPADGAPDRWLDPDAIAQTYLNIHRQHRSAWTWEVELRPWVENF
jgi:NAD(P)-dependent dehydrogenase (short-subunit alcohol dehydrogenase family)